MMKHWIAKLVRRLTAVSFLFLTSGAVIAQENIVTTKTSKCQIKHILENYSSITLLDVSKKKWSLIVNDTASLNKLDELIILQPINTSQFKDLKEFRGKSLTLDLTGIDNLEFENYFNDSLELLDVTLPENCDFNLFWKVIKDTRISILHLKSSGILYMPTNLPSRIKYLSLSSGIGLRKLEKDAILRLENLEDLQLFCVDSSNVILSSLDNNSLKTITLSQYPLEQQFKLLNSLEELEIINQVSISEKQKELFDNCNIPKVIVYDKLNRVVYRNW